MHFSKATALAASIVGAQAVYQGFNYGATKSDGYSFMEEQDFEDRFSRAQNLQGTSGFNSARLYTMIQGGTTDDPSSAFQAAINTQTSLLLGVWCSAGQETVTNEISALTKAIDQYGDDFTKLIVGISVGSEDLYRVTPTGIENEAGLGASPDEIVSYIGQVRDAIADTSASGASIGHVDTWTAWVNGSNSAVVEAVDWLGMDTYPYFQTTVANSIKTSEQVFWDAYDATVRASGGKDVWVTETGWPVSGKTSGQAVASTENAETYWQEVACVLLGNYNTWWYTLEDSDPVTPNPSFGIIGSDLSSQPLYNLQCKGHPTRPPPSSSSSSVAGSSTTKHAGGSHATDSAGVPTASGHETVYGDPNVTGTATNAAATGGAGAAATGTASASASASASTGVDSTGAASQVSSAFGAAILAIFGLVATL